ncbi:MAG: hypothetical protein M3O28_01675 [Actinomycetota bacterium]|nr:hypothetical protein [Actinomycetota bacterium]
MAEAPAPRGVGRPVPAQGPAAARLAAWSETTAVRPGSYASPSGLPPEPAPYRPRVDQPCARPSDPHETPDAPASVERGLPGWGALLVLLAIAGVGGIIDTLSGSNVRGGFNYGVVIASVVAILVVRRSGMFPIVVAPPIVYSVASGGIIYIRSGGLHDRRVIFDAAANWLVYGFPAIAAATAAVLIVAGIRLVIHR